MAVSDRDAIWYASFAHGSTRSRCPSSFGTRSPASSATLRGV
jgi:hypothetical protein